MTRHKRTSIFITTIFGFIYVMANAAYLPATTATVVRLIAIVAAVALFVGTPRPDRPDPPGVGFTRNYWLIVAAEVVVGLGGLAFINGVLGIHDVSVAWISLVVGVHFFGFYVIWGFPVMIWIGVAITACGGAGLVGAAFGESAMFVAVAAGILPGFVLLAGGLRGLLDRGPANAAGEG